jgi:hypothetical protein
MELRLTYIDGNSNYFWTRFQAEDKFPAMPQVTRHQRLTGPGSPLKNVLTAKKGLFWGVLAGKQGFCAIRKSDFFAFFHVWAVFCSCKWLSASLFRKIAASPKNRAGKPTVGFLVCGTYAMIAR